MTARSLALPNIALKLTAAVGRRLTRRCRLSLLQRGRLMPSR
jgi:hypothetical protein